jgi:hypothetical protein
MKSKGFSTRRSFLSASAALSAPLALVATHDANSTEDRRTLEARLAALEDSDAIRTLQRAYALGVNARDEAAVARLFANPRAVQLDASICALAADFPGEGNIEIATNREAATARVPCTVRVAAPIEAPGCTLVDMARLQGEGVVRRTERRTLTQLFVREAGAWKLERVTYAVLGSDPLL